MAIVGKPFQFFILFLSQFPSDSLKNFVVLISTTATPLFLSSLLSMDLRVLTPGANFLWSSFLDLA